MYQVLLAALLSCFFIATVALADCGQSGDMFACDSSNPSWSVKLSRRVSVGYRVEATQFRYYTFTTGHLLGDKIYATSQANTQVVFKYDTAMTASDVSAAAVTPVSSSPYQGQPSWTAL